MNKAFQETKQALAKEGIVQGFNGLPLYLVSSAWSGFPMKKLLGFGYTAFAFRFEHESGDMPYLKSDFLRIWEIVKAKLQKDRKYLHKIYKQYITSLEKNYSLFTQLDKRNVKKLSGPELVFYFHKAVEAQINSVGVSHIIEAASYGLENDLRSQLQEELPGVKNFNEIYALLTAPTKPSFLARERKQLWAIKQLPKTKQLKALQKHQTKYYWLQNNYVRAKVLSVSFFAKQLKSASRPETKDTIRQKRLIQKKLRLSQRVVTMANLIDFLTIWQDERKEHIMRSIAYLDTLTHALENKFKLPNKTLNYLTTREALSLNLKNLPQLKTLLSERSKGVYMLVTQKSERIIIGKDYRALRKLFNQTTADNTTIVQGVTASPGQATGRVVICVQLSALSKVRQGDVLVAHMTRPEYMPALRKAAAIVTDQGGITSHAAIVARELNIPAIIGTKVATQVFKDGDIVEVNANEAQVRKL